MVYVSLECFCAIIEKIKCFAVCVLVDSSQLNL